MKSEIECKWKKYCKSYPAKCSTCKHGRVMERSIIQVEHYEKKENNEKGEKGVKPSAREEA